MESDDIRKDYYGAAVHEANTLDGIIAMLDEGESRETIRAIVAQRSKELFEEIMKQNGNDISIMPDELLPF